jgi:hypothetical protein
MLVFIFCWVRGHAAETNLYRIGGAFVVLSEGGKAARSSRIRSNWIFDCKFEMRRATNGHIPNESWTMSHRRVLMILIPVFRQSPCTVARRGTCCHCPNCGVLSARKARSGDLVTAWAHGAGRDA